MSLWEVLAAARVRHEDRHATLFENPWTEWWSACQQALLPVIDYLGLVTIADRPEGWLYLHRPSEPTWDVLSPVAEAQGKDFFYRLGVFNGWRVTPDTDPATLGQAVITALDHDALSPLVFGAWQAQLARQRRRRAWQKYGGGSLLTAISLAAFATMFTLTPRGNPGEFIAVAWAVGFSAFAAGTWLLLVR
ncbi:MAG: hypothetical protein OWU84_00555 [Firmicutes bacterium]|nr:hypothetical protein [Bacillota bacterium]